MNYCRLILLFLFLMGCNNSQPEKIRILIEENANESILADTILILDKEKINIITSLLHDKKKEPLKFRRVYELNLIFVKDTIKYFGNGEMLRDRNSSYLLPEDERLQYFLNLIHKNT